MASAYILGDDDNVVIGAVAAAAADTWPEWNAPPAIAIQSEIQPEEVENYRMQQNNFVDEETEAELEGPAEPGPPMTFPLERLPDTPEAGASISNAARRQLDRIAARLGVLGVAASNSGGQRHPKEWPRNGAWRPNQMQDERGLPRGYKHARRHRAYPLRRSRTNAPLIADGVTFLSRPAALSFAAARSKLDAYAKRGTLAQLLARDGVDKNALLGAAHELVGAMHAGQALENALFSYRPGASNRRAAAVDNAVARLRHALAGALVSLPPRVLAIGDGEAGAAGGAEHTDEKARADFQAKKAALLATLQMRQPAPPAQTVKANPAITASNKRVENQTKATATPPGEATAPTAVLKPTAENAAVQQARDESVRTERTVTTADVEEGPSLNDVSGDSDASGPVQASVRNFRGEMAVLMEAHAKLFTRFVIGTYRGVPLLCEEAARDSKRVVRETLDVMQRDGLFEGSAAGGLTRKTAEEVLNKHVEVAFEAAEEALAGTGIVVKIARPALRPYYAPGREGRPVIGAVQRGNVEQSSAVQGAELESLVDSA